MTDIVNNMVYGFALAGGVVTVLVVSYIFFSYVSDGRTLTGEANKLVDRILGGMK